MSTINSKKLADVYKELKRDFPKEAAMTSTVNGFTAKGYRSSYIIDRLNDVCGLGGWTLTSEIIEKNSYPSPKKGTVGFHVTLYVTITLICDDGKEIKRSQFGNHVSYSSMDAFKGALTNGLKKCASMFGVGLKAYNFTQIDDDVPAGAVVGASADFQKSLASFLGDDFTEVKNDVEDGNIDDGKADEASTESTVIQDVSDEIQDPEIATRIAELNTQIQEKVPGIEAVVSFKDGNYVLVLDDKDKEAWRIVKLFRDNYEFQNANGTWIRAAA